MKLVNSNTYIYILKSDYKIQNYNFKYTNIFRRNHGINRGKGQGVVEWTRNDEIDDVIPLPAPLPNELASQDGQPVKRAVARKSTTALKKPDQSSSDANRIRWESKGMYVILEDVLFW